MESLEAGPGREAAAGELRVLLDEEISRLPRAYREAVVLCYLGGHTQEAAARQLGCAAGTVAWRLAWARERLRARLTRRGLDCWAGVLPGGVGSAAWTAPRLPLIETTVNAGLAVAGGEVAAGPAAVLAEGALRIMAVHKVKWAAAVFLAAGLLGQGAGLLGWPAAREQEPVPARAERVDRGSVRLSPEDVTRLGVRVVAARAREALPRRLELAGSLAIRGERLARIRTRSAPAEVVELITARTGEAVKKGQALAVLSSKGVGEKKGDLLAAILQKRLDEEILDRAEKAADAVPEVFLLNARRNVLASRTAEERLRRTLRTWGIDQAEIAEVEQEAKRISAAKGKRDLKKEKAIQEKWGRVVLRAPFDGFVVERNVVVGDWVGDGTATLFVVSDLRQLTVLVPVPEEELAGLQALQARHRPRPVPWQVCLAAGGQGALLKSAGMAQISPVIDPFTHTSFATGVVDNAGGVLRAGQFIRVTVFIPVPPGEIVVPTSALVETGSRAFVFVQVDPKKPVFTQRRVFVVRRGRDTAHVRMEPPGSEKQGGSPPLRVGEKVVTEGALEIKAALDDLRKAGTQD